MNGGKAIEPRSKEALSPGSPQPAVTKIEEKVVQNQPNNHAFTKFGGSTSTTVLIYL